MSQPPINRTEQIKASLPDPPEDHTWSVMLGTDLVTVNGQPKELPKVHMALVRRENGLVVETVHRGVIDVEFYGYEGALQWARRVAADHVHRLRQETRV